MNNNLFESLKAWGFSEEAIEAVLPEFEQRFGEKKGLWANIHAKRKRIKAGSGERMRKPGDKGAPSAKDLKDSDTDEKK